MTTVEASEALPDRVSRLITLLTEERKSFTSVEIAETLWLAMQIEPTAQVKPEDPVPAPIASSSTIVSEPEPADPDFSSPPLPDPTPRVNIAAPTPEVGVLPPQALPVWLADPAMLTDALSIIRALKPLLQKVAAGSGNRLDEAATVDHIARTQMVLPILKPEQEPWFDLVLVVDRGSSMHIWQRLVKDLVRILRCYGAFRDVQVFDLEVNQTASSSHAVQLISKPHRPGHRPSELIDQRGRRIVIVLSDCAGKYWWDGTLLPMLQTWGNMMPTVIWQMLPAWMWKRTALGRGTAVAISNDSPGVANQRLKMSIQELEEPEDAEQRIPVPVVTSEVRHLARWSLMVAGDRRAVTPGFLLPQQGGAVPRSKGMDEIARDRAQKRLDDGSDIAFKDAFNQELYKIADERVQRFLELSSPLAQRLIMLLAAAPVITLPVVRLIRDAMLAEASSPLPVAEVFLSGLLLRLSGQEDGELERVLQAESDRVQAQLEPSDSEQPRVNELEAVQVDRQDLVQYDFAPKVRDILLETLPAVDTIEVINSVSAAVERRWNQFSTESFQTFLTNPNVEVPEELAGLRSFASVTADILLSLGGQYTDFVQLLRGAGGKPPSDDPPEEHDDFPLEDLEYEVAKLVNFPPLQPSDYESATITAILDRFDFETASIARLNSDSAGTLIDWNDNKKRKAFREALQRAYPNQSDLEIFVFEELNANLGVISAGNNLQMTVFDLVRWAQATGRLDEVFQAFCRENPNAPVIAQLQERPPAERTSSLREEDWKTLFEQFLPYDHADIQRAFLQGFRQAFGVDFLQVRPDNPPLTEQAQIQELLATYDNPGLAVWFVESVIAEFQRSSEEAGRDLTGLKQWRDLIVHNNEILPPGQYEIQEVTSAREQQYRSTQQYQGEWHWRIDRSRAATWGYTESLSTEPSADINLDMIFIPSGSFTMGAPPSEPDSQDRERPQHEVTLPPFYLGRYTVTQVQWRVVAGYDRIDRDLDPDPSNFKGDNRPVQSVSWEDAQEFCRRLSAQTGKDYRLPSEAQWEYGCRAGTTTPFHFGETITPELVNYDGTETYNDGPKGEHRKTTIDVGSFPANDWGLHDMHGNVWEWCEDDWHDSYEGAPSDGSAWVESDRTKTNRLLRGGSWCNFPGDCRSADRNDGSRGDRTYYVGFRVCCVPPRFSS